MIAQKIIMHARIYVCVTNLHNEAQAARGTLQIPEAAGLRCCACENEENIAYFK